MAKPTPEQLQQLRDAKQWQADRGQDTGVLGRIIEIGEEQAARPDPSADQT